MTFKIIREIKIFQEDSNVKKGNISKSLKIYKSKRERRDELGSDDKSKDISKNPILKNTISYNTIIYYNKRDYNVEYIHKLKYKDDSNFSLNDKIQIDSDKFNNENKINLKVEEGLQKQFDTTNLYSPIPQELQKPKASLLQLALKTNLLYYLALAPNIELEMQYKSFSLNFDYLFPWYVNTPKRFCYQLLLGGVEGRYWFNKKSENKPLTGFFMGLNFGMGLFDFQNGEEGTQGDINFLCGISGGYSKSISKNFNLEFSLSLGYLKSNNINYYAYDELLIKKNDSEFSYFGPTKAKVSLVWFINNKKY